MPYKYKVVTGSSYVAVTEAAKEAENAANAAASKGWEAIGVGAGGRAAGGGGESAGGPAQVVDVVVLMRKRVH